MIKLTKVEISQLRQLVNSSQWETVKRVASLYATNLLNNSLDCSSRWKFISSSLLKKGKIMGIDNLLQEINKLTEND